MSEQTPDTTEGVSNGQDPSMEDILASIRKIIAEDDGASAEAVETKADFGTSAPVTGDVADLVEADKPVLDTMELDTLDLDVLDEDLSLTTGDAADVEALIGDMDVKGTEVLSIPEIEMTPASETITAKTPGDDVLDLIIPMDDVETPLKDAVYQSAEEPLAMENEILDLLSDDDITISDDAFEDTPKTSSGSLMGGAAAALGLGGAMAAGREKIKTPNIDPGDVADPQDDLSLLLDNMLEDSGTYIEEEEPVADERVVDPAEDLLAELDLEEGTELLVSDVDMLDALDDEPMLAGKPGVDPDIVLVKSLMKDLTEDPLDELELEAEPEPQSEVVDAAANIDESDSIDIMDEILSANLDDEMKLSEEIMPEVIPEVIIEPEIVAAETVTESAPSLKEIAAQAEADAKEAESGLGLAAVAGLGAVGAAAIASTEITEDSDMPDDVETALTDLDNLLVSSNDHAEDLIPEDPENIAPEPLIEETTEMPRAKKTDAIIDEVTESATAGAFASLTSVVEEKATVAERGDRIGDLVMEALQPMLKEWLDANLKGIVERAVTKEVKRISSGK